MVSNCRIAPNKSIGNDILWLSYTLVRFTVIKSVPNESNKSV